MQLRFDARARAILKRPPVPNVYSLAELVLLAVLAVQLARLVWTVLTPVTPLGDWRPAGPVYPSAPGEVLGGFDPFYRISGTQPQGAGVVTSLQLKLFGTRIDEAMGRGSAILAGPDGVQKSVAVGEEIIPGVILREVAFDHVTIDRGGVREDLFLDQSGGGAPTAVPVAAAPDAAISVPPAAAPAGVSLQQFQREIGYIPRIDGGRISGLVVRPQGSGAAFRSAGLRDGDIVTQIGGRPVQGPADIERLGSQFAAGGNLSLMVERGGQTVPIVVTLAPGEAR